MLFFPECKHDKHSSVGCHHLHVSTGCYANHFVNHGPFSFIAVIAFATNTVLIWYACVCVCVCVPVFQAWWQTGDQTRRAMSCPFKNHTGEWGPEERGCGGGAQEERACGPQEERPHFCVALR